MRETAEGNFLPGVQYLQTWGKILLSIIKRRFIRGNNNLISLLFSVLTCLLIYLRLPLQLCIFIFASLEMLGVLKEMVFFVAFSD